MKSCSREKRPDQSTTKKVRELARAAMMSAYQSEINGAKKEGAIDPNITKSVFKGFLH